MGTDDHLVLWASATLPFSFKTCQMPGGLELRGPATSRDTSKRERGSTLFWNAVDMKQSWIKVVHKGKGLLLRISISQCGLGDRQGYGSYLLLGKKHSEKEKKRVFYTWIF